MTAEEKEAFLYGMGWPQNARIFRIKGTTEIIKASCIKEACRKLVGDEFTYTRHWYTRSKRKSWASVETPWGYKCIVEEL